jgi:hypothetical protein
MVKKKKKKKKKPCKAKPTLAEQATWKSYNPWEDSKTNTLVIPAPKRRG